MNIRGLKSEMWGVMSDSGAYSEMTRRCTGHIQIALSKRCVILLK